MSPADSARLRAIRAPRGFTSAVLAATGLADRYAPMQTALGPVFVAFNERGASYVARAKNAKVFETRFTQHFGRRAVAAAEVPAAVLKKFDLAQLSEFQRSVLRKTLEIPRGEVRPYSWIAAQIGRPKAVRAVGTALAKNPVPLLIPCHRVVRSDGSIGEYALGAPNKRRILASEGVKFPFGGRVSKGSDPGAVVG